MSSVDRKIKRDKQKKARKQARKETQQAFNAMASLPTECSDCGAKFDLVRSADDWIVESGSSLRLMCPTCAALSLPKAHN